MKKRALINVLFLAVLVFGCAPDNSNNFNDQAEEKEVILKNSDQSERINTSNIGVIDITEAPEEDPAFATAKTNSSTDKPTSTEPDIASNIPLTLVAEVSAPSYNGTKLKATHVAINEEYAYVSYNVEGNTYLGAIDVIDITDPTNPQISFGAIFINTDISAVNYYNNALYIAGATSSPNIDETNPAVLIKMELENGLPTKNITWINMESYVSTDVLANENGIYGVSGSNGVLAHYDISNQSFIKSTAINDLRAIGQSNDKIIVLSGTDGVFVYNNNLNEISNFKTHENIADSKRTIDFHDNNILISEGKEGLGIYNLDNGNKLTKIDLPTITETKINENDVVTNAVTIENNHIFMANGAAGIAIHDLQEGINNITKTGTLDLDGSVNYVKSAGGYIFVASGAGGLKIIKTVDNNSNNSETSINCAELSSYTGGSWLNINSNQPQAYQGATSLKGLNISADFTFCGSLPVSQGLNLNSGGNFYMKGSMAQGNNHSPWNQLIINNNATLYVEGSLVIYGNMQLNNGATIEFLGNGSSITIYGDVNSNGTVTINGTFTDTFNKLGSL